MEGLHTPAYILFKHIYPSNLWLKTGSGQGDGGALSREGAQSSAMEKSHDPQCSPPAPEECLRCHVNAFGGSTL